MADPTASEALGFLSTVIGAGGATAILIAVLGTRRPKPAEKADAPTVGISALLADHLAMERFTTQVSRLADAAEDMAKAVNRVGDMMDIARAVERLRKNETRD